MTSKILSILFVAAIAIALISCSDSSEGEYGDTFLLGVYEELGNGSDDGLLRVYMSTIVNIHNERSVQGFLTNVYSLNRVGQNIGDLKLNDLNFEFEECCYEPVGISGSFEIGELLESFAGSYINWTITSIEDGSIVLSEDAYFPKAIDATFTNEGRFEESRIDLIRRDGFVLEWNEDTENDNGMLVSLFYRGLVIDQGLPKPSDQNNVETIERSILLEDTGIATISSEFFEGIPANGAATMILTRGDVKSIKDFEDHKFQLQVLQDQNFSIGIID